MTTLFYKGIEFDDWAYGDEFGYWTNISEGDKFKIDRIISVSSGFKKGDDDKRKQAIAIDAELTKVEG